MCERRDLGAALGERAERKGGEIREGRFRPRDLNQEIFEPSLYLYDAYPGGIGLSEPLYHLSNELLLRVGQLITGCPCKNGCPSCVGPAGEQGDKIKGATLAILECLCER
jgi:DEAD/DEAH box helicase domain-containing protein